MIEFLIACLYFPITLAGMALFSYFFIYKKEYFIRSYHWVYLVVIIACSFISLMFCLVFAKLFNINISYLSILGGSTGLLISPLIGLSNKNLKKLSKSDEAITSLKTIRRQKLRAKIKKKRQKLNENGKNILK